MVVWMEKQFRVFLLKEVRSRGEMADRIGLELRQLLFEFKHPWTKLVETVLVLSFIHSITEDWGNSLRKLVYSNQIAL